MSPITDEQASSRMRFRPGYLALALGAVVVAALPLLFTTRYSTNLLILGAAMSIGTLGLVVVLGYAGQISLAQAAFYGIGAYAVALGTTRWELNWWVALVLGLVAAALAGAVLGMATLKLGGHYLAMVTICFQVIFTLIATNWVTFTGGPDGISNIKRPPFFIPLNSAQKYAWFALAVLFLVAGLVWWLRDTVLGRSMRAVRENEIAAENFLRMLSYIVKRREVLTERNLERCLRVVRDNNKVVQEAVKELAIEFRDNAAALFFELVRRGTITLADVQTCKLTGRTRFSIGERVGE